MTRIKICGITNPQDAEMAAACGADAIGLVFYRNSPRAINAAQAAQIVGVTPPFVSIVALFVNETAEKIRAVLAEVAVDVLQFHGDESPQFCRQFHRPYIKAVRVKPDTDLIAGCEAFRDGRGVLLDAFQEGVPGGTGKCFDWSLATPDLPVPIILAGGLNEQNVQRAIKSLRPAAVDVSGGVEQSPGIKDHAKIQNFISAVKAADQQ